MLGFRGCLQAILVLSIITKENYNKITPFLKTKNSNKQLIQRRLNQKSYNDNKVKIVFTNTFCKPACHSMSNKNFYYLILHIKIQLFIINFIKLEKSYKVFIKCRKSDIITVSLFCIILMKNNVAKINKQLYIASLNSVK